MNGTGSRTGASGPAGLPGLHLADWLATKDTLHLYCQIVGKIRLATYPRHATTGGTCRCMSMSAV